MNYSKFVKTLWTLIVYILLAGGAIVMLLPFAWMIMTSLKTSSEINLWPPTWTTKNFQNEWDLNLKLTPSKPSPRTGLSLSEFRILSTQESYDPYKLVYEIDGDFVSRGRVQLSLNEIDYTQKTSIEGMMSDIYDYISNIELREDLSSLFAVEDYSLENFESIYFGLFSQENGYFKQTTTIRRIQQSISKVQNFIDITLERNINLLPYFRINPNMTESQIENITRNKEIFSDYLETIKLKVNDLNSKLSSYPAELRIIREYEVEQIINLLADFLSEIQTFEDGILSNTNTLIQKNIYEPIMKDINTLTFYMYFKEKYSVEQGIKVEDVNIIFDVPTRKTKYQNIINGIQDSEFPESFKQIVISLVNERDIDNLNQEVVSYLENDFLNDVRNSLIEDSRNLSKYTQIIRTLSTNQVTFEQAQKILTQSDYNFLIEHVQGKEEEFSRILEKRKEYDRILTEFNKFFLDTISIVNIVNAPSFVDMILYKNNSNIELYTVNVPSIWLLDDVPSGKVEYSFNQVLGNIFQNYVDAWNAAPFSRYYINTVFVALVTTVLEIIFASMAAFAFSKLNFWGKDIIFVVFLATMMIPGEVLLVPNYITISKFSWIDSYYALIIPWVISVFAIFLIRQQFMTVPNELWDAAKIDGSSSWRFLWTVMVPLSRPAILTGALLKFVGSWNAFLWVLIVTKSPEMRTLSVGLQNFRTDAGEIYNLLMAASTFTMIPIVILFIFLQRYFIEGIARTGLKG
ncbi:carbohydrate ABC transporter permease [Petrotoga olearia]|uniref:ABC transmembrane type-1 domain-containing protein n=2 Tax=Petrotoga olearia TaxID=156203 RepID=A0A2K1P2D2_9BACT|nr:carbohydrate ABC transporter permease [Petrotoga olearia]PNR96932.1 hypothetical protein X929_03825 [Petrotoga olearia DSM 13574]RMA70560.1 carbohydrate ABC transporter membrane protein 2 (CUT1 family) [Petrotoga olearia]